MKTSKLKIAMLASLVIVMTSCGNNESGHIHQENVDQNHETLSNSNRNNNGELIDANGEIITGCPQHKEMIGSEGDLCPKCNYMKMIPITWSIEGIDTVRVTSLPQYSPPVE